ncbi:hypothetical protein EOD39_17952 [Acipenser ruthenus]|uniref:Uncharacterized protein n=1 Tax=Acipenser ruthenus TaxID=7906 RepID=A0A444V1Y8_ACIRT|nr:hypothetical protein EOD39_17952 [Acipenser ruthenus]
MIRIGLITLLAHIL